MASWVFMQQDVLTSSFYACLLFVISAFLYHLTVFLKFKIKINAECWFCMKTTLVSLTRRNSFTCGNCEQYNGFCTKSGSYNRVIEEQHYDFNEVSYCKPISLENFHQHRLCDACNTNQEMKIKMLAEFVPLDEANFDKEVAEFRKHLESVYQICLLCELLLEKVLEKPKNTGVRRSLPPTLNSTTDNYYSATAKFEDRTTSIRKQIKDLSLTDFDSSLDNRAQSPFGGTFTSKHTSSNPFSTSYCLTPPKSPSLFTEDSFGSSRNFSFFQYKFNKPNTANPFAASKGQFIALTHLSERNRQFGGSGSPRILNYYVNYEQCPSGKSNQVEATASYSSNWLSHMLHTFELTLFLVIIGLIIVLLSMPITLSYNSDFNSFSLSVVINNFTN